MLIDGYLAKFKTYSKDEELIVVTAVAKSILAPSWVLLNDYKTGRINWKEYERRFRIEMLKPEAIKEMQRIKELAKTKTVRLICYEKQYPCHRFILIDMIKELGSKWLPLLG